jgi:hypothetical protein
MENQAAIPAHHQPEELHLSEQQARLVQINEARSNFAEYAHSPNDQVEIAYSVSRALFEETIIEQTDNPDQKQGVARALELIRAENAMHFVVKDTLPEDASASYTGSGNVIAGETIAARTIRYAREIHASNTKKLEDTGVQFKSPVDAELITMLTTVGHEMGHVVAKGLSYRVANKNQANWRSNDIGIRPYLVNHPELGVTGNWDEDFPILGERLAEGVGLMTTDQFLNDAGYNERERATLLNAVSMTFKIHGEHGHSPLDHIQKTDHETSTNDLSEGKAAAIDLAYALPLEVEEIADLLAETAQIIDDDSQNSISVVPEDKAQWAKQVHETMKTNTQAALLGATVLRATVLEKPVQKKPYSTKKIAAALGIGVSVVGLSAVGMHLYENQQSERPAPVVSPTPASTAEMQRMLREHAKNTHLNVNSEPLSITSTGIATPSQSTFKTIRPAGSTPAGR